MSRAAGAWGLAALAALALAACGEKEEDVEESGAREAAVEWAKLATAGDPEACELTTLYGKGTMLGWTGRLSCQSYGQNAEFIPRALLLENPNDLHYKLAHEATEETATGREGEAVTRLSFSIPLGTVEVDLVEEDGEWLFNDGRAVVDPLAGNGSEEIDAAAVEGVDRSDLEAVLAAWGALAAAKDPSACLLTHPRFVYSVVRAEIASSCAEMITSGFPLGVAQLGAEPLRPDLFARAAATARGGEVEPPGPAEPGPADERQTRFERKLANGDTVDFDLATVDGEWTVELVGASSSDPPLP